MANKGKLALVLCGGGSLGAYEMGVWKLLRELNIKPDIVTGTSIGALIGAMVVADDYDGALHMWNTISAEKVMVDGLNFDEEMLKGGYLAKNDKKIMAFVKQYFKHKGVNISPFREVVKNAINPAKVMQSDIDFGFVVCSFPDFQEIDLRKKDVREEELIPYLHASSACWPIFPVETVFGKKYVDGGYKNNLPIDFAIEMGATEIIAVELDAIPKAQFSDLEDLPIVSHKMVPTWNTGSMMDFKQSSIQKNITLGYLDAQKAFGLKDGFRYTFDKIDPKYEALMDQVAEFFFLNVVKFNVRDFKSIDKLLRWRLDGKLTTRDYFYRAIELAAEEFDVDYHKTYNVFDFIIMLSKKLHTTRKSKELKNDLAKCEKHDFNVPFKSLLYYAYDRALNDMSLKGLGKYVIKYPLLAVVLSLADTYQEFEQQVKEIREEKEM